VIGCISGLAETNPVDGVFDIHSPCMQRNAGLARIPGLPYNNVVIGYDKDLQKRKVRDIFILVQQS
jgi:hypothetical protein